MKHLLRNTKKSEGLVYVVIWLVVFLMPVFLLRSSSNIDSKRVGFEWFKMAPFFIIFLVHNYFLFPMYFIPKKRIKYLGLSVLLVVFISSLWILGGRYLFLQPGKIPAMPPGLLPIPREMQVRVKPWYLNFFDSAFVSILVVGFNAAIKLTVKEQKEEMIRRTLEKEKLQTELAFLRNQVSPHFFMNTLNNIHALIDVNAEDAKESIVKLSRLMRYLLYDSENEKTTLPKEVEFIKNYVELMKLRVVSNIDIQLSFPEKIPQVEIPPMLFISLVENAFKHGISYQSESFIEIYMQIRESNLYFRIKNSLHKNVQSENEGGIGLKNLKKRLELLYDSNFSFKITEENKCFEINIILPLYGN